MQIVNLIASIESEYLYADQGMRQVSFECLRWDETCPLYAPFYLPEKDFQQAVIPFSFAVIGRERNALNRGLYVAVRTDAYPLLWAWWFVWYRVMASWRYIEMCLVYVAEVWGLVELEPYTLPTWRDLFRRRSINRAP